MSILFAQMSENW